MHAFRGAGLFLGTHLAFGKRQRGVGSIAIHTPQPTVYGHSVRAVGWRVRPYVLERSGRAMWSLSQPLRISIGAVGMVLMALGAGVAGAVEPNSSELSDGQLVDQFDRRNRAFEGFLKAEVAGALNHARVVIASRPKQAAETLEVLLDKVRRATDVDPSPRAQLVREIEAALRLAHRQAEVHAERQLAAQHATALGDTRKRSALELSVQDQKAAQYVTQINALMAEGRYRDAETLASVADEAVPGHAVFGNAVLLARMKGNTSDYYTLRTMREKGLVEAYYQEEISSVPTPDQQPILFPDAEAWQLLTNSRKRHAVDVKPRGANELRIMEALDEKTECDFIEQPLSDVIDYFKQLHGIEIQLDRKALAEAGVDGGVPITRSVQGITLRSALQLLLREFDLTYVIRYEVLLITSKTEAENMRDARVYPVADLVERNAFKRRAARRYGIHRMTPAAAAGFGAF
jgi:hypothetical protein